MCSGLDVAARFGKRHDDVLKAVRLLGCSGDFHQRNFEPVEIIEKNAIGGTVTKKWYDMTRDGFSFLAMGFGTSKLLNALRNLPNPILDAAPIWMQTVRKGRCTS